MKRLEENARIKEEFKMESIKQGIADTIREENLRQQREQAQNTELMQLQQMQAHLQTGQFLGHLPNGELDPFAIPATHPKPKKTLS